MVRWDLGRKYDDDDDDDNDDDKEEEGEEEEEEEEEGEEQEDEDRLSIAYLFRRDHTVPLSRLLWRPPPCPSE